MRYAYFPVVSARNVQAAPSYNWWLGFRDAALARDPDSVFYVVVPKEGDGTRWSGGADWSGPRTEVVPVAMHEWQSEDLALVTEDFWRRFNERWGDCYFDVLVNERPILAPLLRRLAAFPKTDKSRKPLIVNRDQYIETCKDDRVHPVEELLEAAGWASVPTIFQSPHQAKRARSVAVRRLAPAMVQDLMDSCVVFPLGIDCSYVDQVNKPLRDQKNERITINYSHKLFAAQMFVESLSIMDSVFAGGRPVELQIVTGSSKKKMEMFRPARPYRYIETYGSMNRAAFLRQIAKAHVFISNSWYEDFSATVVEQMYTGLVPVLRRYAWSEYLVPEGYPYLFGTMAEGQAMLRYVVDHYEEIAAEWVPQIQAKVRQEFDQAVVLDRMVAWMEGLHEERLAALESRATRALLDVVDAAYATLPPVFTADDVYRVVLKVSDHIDLKRMTADGNATSPWLMLDLLRRRHPDITAAGPNLTFQKGGQAA